VDQPDLNDENVLESMRDELAHVRLSAPVDDVLARGRRLRRRRTLPALGAGAGTVAAVVALTFSLGAPGAGSGHSTHATLDAWTVVSKPGGTVSLTIRDERESSQVRAGLQRALRQAGVSAVVEASAPRGCGALAAMSKAIMVTRHHHAVTASITVGKLPKRARVAVLVPSVLKYRSKSGHTVHVRVRHWNTRHLRYKPKAEVTVHGRQRQGQAAGVVTQPQVVLLSAGRT
jgi:hypothetical protein